MRPSVNGNKIELGVIPQYSGFRDTMLKYVASTGPLITGFAIPRELSSYKTGVFTLEECTNRRNYYHALTIVGYGTDSDTGKDYWLVKNSWGPNWGERGFGKIERGSKACQLETDSIAILN